MFAPCFAAAASNPQSLQQSLTPHGNQTVWKPRFAGAPEFDPQAPKQVHELQSRLLKRCAEGNRMRKCRPEYLGMAMRLANTLGGEQSADWVEGEEFSLEEFDGLLAISTYNDAEPPPQSCGDCLSGNCYRVSFLRLKTCSKCSHEHCAHPTCASQERQKYCSADAQAIARHESVSFGWTLDPRVAEEPGQFTGCPDGQRNPAESECLAAVQEAAQGMHVRGIRVVNEGPEGVVPGGCSYSHPSQRAMFNRNPAGRSSSLYTLVCAAGTGEGLPQPPVADDSEAASRDADVGDAPTTETQPPEEGLHGPGIEWATAAPRLSFGTCAVIGSGKSLYGKNLGAQIDAHDVVMHVNNIPLPEEHVDLGSRTDILFSTFCAAKHAKHKTTGGYDGFSVAYRTEPSPVYSDVCQTVGGYPCPFPALVFRSSILDATCQSKHKAEEMSRFTTAVTMCGTPPSMVSRLVHHVRRDGTPYAGKPTTGFHALVAMAFACQSVELYGFSGSETYNGHQVSADHGLEAEHAAIAALINRTLSPADYPDEETAVAWERTNVRHAG